MDTPPVQFADSLRQDRPARDAEVQSIAAAGTAGSGEALPFLDVIQKSFGPHDVRGIQAHRDESAENASGMLGASAFAVGNHIAFGRSPDLHTASHEAAHVIQQRAGVKLKGAVGTDGDIYERHADDVADKVVRGESASELLDTFAPAASAGSALVQLKPVRPMANAPISYTHATSVIDAYTRELESAFGQLQAARGLKQHAYVRSVARLVNVTADKLEETAHSIQAEHQEQTDHPMNVKAEATAPLIAKSRELANRTLEQLDAMDEALAATAEQREGIPEPKSVGCGSSATA